MRDQVTAYAKAVTSGKIIAGPYVRAACRRHMNDLAHGAGRGLRWDVAAAARVIRFFKNVLTVEVEVVNEYQEVETNSVPFILEPWQAFIVGSLFGWKNKHGFRRFRRAYIEIAKGNGKSPIAAGIGHYMFTAMGKQKAEIYSAATGLDQAEILFRDAVSMRQKSRWLRRRVTSHGEKKVRQMSNTTQGFFKPISAEKRGKSGPRPYCALLDEIHEHADNGIIEMMRAGTKGNREALIFEITNSGSDKKTVCGQEHDYSVQIMDGELENDAWFAYIACLDTEETSPDGVADEPFTDESCWIKANPNLGVSIQKEYIREQVVEAEGMPSKEGTIRRLNFCQWTESASMAIPRAVWTACQGEVNPEELTEAGYPCYGGLDLSKVRDLTAFTLTWLLEKRKDEWKFASKTWFWTPLDTLKDRAKSDKAPYEAWAKANFLEAIPGNRIKYPWVANALGSLCAKYSPVIIGCDQYGLENMRDSIEAEGLDLPCVVHPQGFNRRKIGVRDEEEEEGDDADKTGANDVYLWMPDSINKTEAALIDKRITVDPNPVMTMCAGGVVYTENRTAHRMFDKSKATRRIDGMVSLAMSIGVATAELPESEHAALERAIAARGGFA